MMYRTICTMCVHFEAGDETAGPRCAAFPQGIPDEIARQGYDHRNPFEGDNGIMFTPDGPIDVDRIEAVVNPKMERNPANW